MKKTKSATLSATIRNELNSSKEEFREYAEERGLIDVFDEYCPDGDFENMAWEAGYLRGLEVALNLLNND